MSRVDVSTQKQLDAALKGGDDPCCVGDGEFTVDGSATVWADGSATVRADGSATVWADGSATVWADGSATVWADGSATVRADGSATVWADGSATVRAYGSATVRAYGSATVRAGDRVAVHRHSKSADIDGGVVIDQTAAPSAEESSAVRWCERYGVTIPDGDDPIVVLFKVVSLDYRSPRGFDYTPGTTPEAPDWDGGKKECGGGLHFSGSPFHAERFASGGWWPRNLRYVACPVRLADIIVHPTGDYPDKTKAPRCAGPVWECDIHGNPVDAPQPAAVQE
jgi:hypothetical protein